MLGGIIENKLPCLNIDPALSQLMGMSTDVRCSTLNSIIMQCFDLRKHFPSGIENTNDPTASSRTNCQLLISR